MRGIGRRLRAVSGADNEAIMRKPFSLLAPLAIAILLVSTPPVAGADRTLTVTGTISRIQASTHSVSVKLPDGGETSFVWNSDTKINGTLMPGAKVTVRYAPSPDGKNLALQITVARA
jgi:hypothetical protein